MAARLIAVSGFALPIDGPTTVHDPDRHASISTSTAPGRGKGMGLREEHPRRRSRPCSPRLGHIEPAVASVDHDDLIESQSVNG
ncbi:MAG: hypothetical protein IPL75_19355 [Acidobacteria bacterium]|nr:hypothetical protein [Acidobacteriota bacterium]